MKIRPVEAELFHADRRTDGRTDMTKLIVAFLNFATIQTKIQIRSIKKGKAIPLQALTGPEDSRWLRFPDFETVDT